MQLQYVYMSDIYDHCIAYFFFSMNQHQIDATCNNLHGKMLSLVWYLKLRSEYGAILELFPSTLIRSMDRMM